LKHSALLGTRVGGYVPQGLTTLPMPVFSFYFNKNSKQNKNLKIFKKQNKNFNLFKKSKQKFQKFKKPNQKFQKFKKIKQKLLLLFYSFYSYFSPFVLTFGLVLCLLDLLVTESSYFSSVVQILVRFSHSNSCSPR
jgi:hypothetical protein